MNASLDIWWGESAMADSHAKFAVSAEWWIHGMAREDTIALIDWNRNCSIRSHNVLRFTNLEFTVPLGSVTLPPFAESQFVQDAFWLFTLSSLLYPSPLKFWPAHHSPHKPQPELEEALFPFVQNAYYFGERRKSYFLATFLADLVKGSTQTCTDHKSQLVTNGK